jgi:hypothetical protein
MKFTVHHGLRSHRIEGTLLAEVTTEDDSKDRWTEIYLYKVDPGGAPRLMRPGTRDEALPEGGYLSHVIGKSLRAHTLKIMHRSLCRGGVEKEVGALPDEAVPCPVCRPSFAWISSDVCEEDMPAERERVRRAREGITELVRMEVTRHQIHTAVLAEDMIAGLTDGPKVTLPGEDLVRKAARNDPGIQAVVARLDTLAGEEAV